MIKEVHFTKFKSYFIIYILVITSLIDSLSSEKDNSENGSNYYVDGVSIIPSVLSARALILSACEFCPCIKATSFINAISIYCGN